MRHLQRAEEHIERAEKHVVNADRLLAMGAPPRTAVHVPAEAIAFCGARPGFFGRCTAQPAC
jgi:hypothetical protein